MDFTKFQQNRKNLLKDIDTLASYDFYTTIVSLDSCSAQSIQFIDENKETIFKVINGENISITLQQYQELIKARLFIHEYTHFIDCTSTLWGMRYLNIMKNAYESDDIRFKSTEETFHFAKEFNDKLRFARLPKYYTYVTNNSDELPWFMGHSIGRIFNNHGKISNKPILFIKFFNKSKNPEEKLIARSPISLISILECSAMFQEIDFTKNLINCIENDDDRKVTDTLYLAEIREYLYNKNITEYSVCAHLIANTLKISDIYLVFEIAGILCRFILNAPEEFYYKISENFDFSIFYPRAIPRSYNEKKLYPEIYEFIEMIKQGLNNCEAGFLYYLICKFIETTLLGFTLLDLKIKKDIKLILYILDAFVQKYAENLENIREKELENNKEKLSNSKLQEIIDLSNFGYVNFITIENNNKLKMPFLKLNLPPVLLNDGNIYSIFKSDENQMCNYDIDKLYDSLIKGQLWVERFTEACE